MVKKWLIQKILDRPKTLLFSMLTLSLLLSSGIFKIQSEYSHKIWFRQNDPYLEELEQFERHFGNDETIQLIVKSGHSIYEKNNIELIKHLTEEM